MAPMPDQQPQPTFSTCDSTCYCTIYSTDWVANTYRSRETERQRINEHSFVCRTWFAPPALSAIPVVVPRHRRIKKCLFFLRSKPRWRAGRWKALT